MILQEDNAKQGKFGFPVDNTIGGNPQPNGWMDNWVDFYRERRLRHMLRLVNDSRLTDMGERVAKNMDKMFEGVKVSSDLLLPLQAFVPDLPHGMQDCVRPLKRGLAGALHTSGCCTGEALLVAWGPVVWQPLSSGGWAVGDIRPCLLLWFVPCLAQWRSAPSVHILYTAMFILQLRESSSAPKIVCCTCHGQRKCKSRFPGRLYNMGL